MFAALGSIKIIAILLSLAAFAGVSGYAYVLRADNERLEVIADRVIEINQANVEATAQAIADQATANEAGRAELLDAQARNQQLAEVRDDILQAPETDDGPINPVLRRELDRLRGPTASDPD